MVRLKKTPQSKSKVKTVKKIRKEPVKVKKVSDPESQEAKIEMETNSATNQTRVQDGIVVVEQKQDPVSPTEKTEKQKVQTGKVDGGAIVSLPPQETEKPKPKRGRPPKGKTHLKDGVVMIGTPDAEEEKE